MKYLFIFILIVHALIHILGFLKEFKLLAPEHLAALGNSSLTRNAASAAGLFWLVVCVMLFAAAVGFYVNKAWWLFPATIGVILSQILIIIYWRDAKWGTSANVIILVAIIVSYARIKLDSMVRWEVQQMYSMASSSQSIVVTEDMLTPLPAPVRAWLRSSGVVGKPAVKGLRLKQKGMMRSSPTQDKWWRMHAEQYFVVDRPAFIWKARMRIMPSIVIDARDKYQNGKGEMKICALSIIPVANSTGPQVDQGTLQRYLAETCWFPSAALSPNIHWQPIDENSATATLTYEGVSGTVVFRFNNKHEIAGCTADRYMSSGKIMSLEKWEVKNVEYGTMAGIHVPVKSEATWKLKDGDFTWLKLEILEIDYDKNKLY